MIKRAKYIEKLSVSLKRSPVIALLGPRQCGKTTLARMFGENKKINYFDLESQPDLRRLQNPELMLPRYIDRHFHGQTDSTLVRKHWQEAGRGAKDIFS